MIANSDSQQSKPQSRTKHGAFSQQQITAQPSPPAPTLTPEQIEKAITGGIDAAAQQYESRHPSPPPDNSNWWFSFFLVAFTGGLVMVGVGQCYLLYQQSRVVTAVESPLPLISAFKLVQYETIPGEVSVLDPVPGGDIPPNCRILFIIENKGRSILRMTELCVEKFIGQALPASPIYRTVIPWGMYLERGPIWIRFNDEQAVITPHEVSAANAAYPEGALWVYGYITYLDFFGERLQYKFLWRWDLTAGFLPEIRTGYSS